MTKKTPLKPYTTHLRSFKHTASKKKKKGGGGHILFSPPVPACFKPVNKCTNVFISGKHLISDRVILAEGKGSATKAKY